MAPFEALYGRKCRTPLYWNEVGERKLEGPELVQQVENAIKVIRDRLKLAQNRQKQYADRHRKDRDLVVGDYALLKVSPLKGVMRFGRKGKLSPRYIGPFEVLKKVGAVAYELALPPELHYIHNVFHVSVLRLYKPDIQQTIDYQPIEL